jgi:hypothetical protein
MREFSRKSGFLTALVMITVMFIGSIAEAQSRPPRTAAERALYEKAVRACNSPAYSNGATPFINYEKGWFRCVEPRYMR